MAIDQIDISPEGIRGACTRLEEAAAGHSHRTYANPMERERDIKLVLSAARAQAVALERARNAPTAIEPADSLIPPMTFMGIVVQINPALPLGHCQIIGPEGKLLATFQV